MARTVFNGQKHGRNIENLLTKKPRNNRVIDLLKQVEIENKKKNEEQLSRVETATLIKAERETDKILSLEPTSQKNDATKRFNNVIPITNARKVVVEQQELWKGGTPAEDYISSPEAVLKAHKKIPQGYFTHLDEKVNGILDCVGVISEFIDLMSKANNRIKYVEGKIIEADRRKVDLEHNIEMLWENAYQTFLTDRKLKYALMERRDYKDMLNLVAPIARFATEHKPAMRALEDLLNHIKNTFALQKNRVYYPRSELELPVGDAYRALPLDKQLEIEKNYKTKRGIA